MLRATEPQPLSYATVADCASADGNDATTRLSMTLDVEGKEQQLEFDRCAHLRFRAAREVAERPALGKMQGAGCERGSVECLVDALTAEMFRVAAASVCEDYATGATATAACSARVAAVYRQTLAGARPLTRADVRDAGMACPTDKVGHHGYHRFYYRYLPTSPGGAGVRIFEVGAGRGGGSICMWRRLYPLAEIVVLDLPSGPGENVTEGDDPATQIVRGDMSDPAVLAACAAKGPFDLIVDVSSSSSISTTEILRPSFIHSLIHSFTHSNNNRTGRTCPSTSWPRSGSSCPPSSPAVPTSLRTSRRPTGTVAQTCTATT